MGVSINKDYVKSFPGILKIVQFVLSLAAVGCMAQFTKDVDIEHRDEKVSFFLAAMAVGIIVVILLFVLNILKYSAFSVTFLIEKKIGKSKWNAVLLLIHLVLAVLYVVSSALLVETASDMNKPEILKLVPKLKFRWDNLVAALIFGFVGFALFLVDVVMAVKNIRG